jgi:hypothetical protein
VGDRHAEQEVRDEIQAVDQPARDVRPVHRLHGVDGVGDEQ